MTPTKSRPTTPTQPPAPEGVEESKSTEPIKAKKPNKKTSPIIISNPEEEKKLAKVQLFLKSKNAKKILEEKRKSVNPQDDKTVVETLNTAAETYKTNAQAFKDLVDIYGFLSKNDTIDNLDPDDKVKMKGYMKALGISGKTKKLKN